MNKAHWMALNHMRDGMFVPPELTEQMIKGIRKKKSVGVAYSFEMLETLHAKGFKDVTLIVEERPMKYIINICSKYGYEVKTFEEIEDMKFDIIIGNPPFQASHDNGDRKDQASNLWTRFWADAITKSNSNTKISLITPTGWLSPSADLKGDAKVDGEGRLWDVFNKYTSTANVTDVAKHFAGVGSTFGYVTVDKSGSNGLSFSDGQGTSLGFLPKSGFDEVEANIGGNGRLLSIFKIDQSNTPDLRVSLPMTRTLSPEKIEILQGNCKPTGGSEHDKLYLYLHCPSMEDAKKVKQRIIDCQDILNQHCKWSGFVNQKILSLIKYDV